MRIAGKLRVYVTTGVLLLASVSIARAKYSGGSGTAQDPYQIATAAHRIALGETTKNYDKHFILTADIDLDPSLPGRRVFDRAVIAPDVDDQVSGFQGFSFAGSLDGQAHKIRNLTIRAPDKDYVSLFGCIGKEGRVKKLGVERISITGRSIVAGIAALSQGNISSSYSTGNLEGENLIGGLIGANAGTICSTYSTVDAGGNSHVGGLAGVNEGLISCSYSSGTLTAIQYLKGGFRYALKVGGLVGTTWPSRGEVKSCFWDTQTSGTAESDGGTGKTTPEMRTAKTFLYAGWDLVGETANGTQDIWSITEGKDYPRLWWEATKK